MAGERFRQARKHDQRAKDNSSRLRRLREQWERQQILDAMGTQARLKQEFLARHPEGRI